MGGFIQSLESPGLTAVMKFFTLLASTVPVVILSLLAIVLLFAVLGHRRELVFFLAAVGGSALLNDVLKSLIRRERPSVHRLAEETGFSFPSGHTMAAFTLFGALAFLLWRHIPARWGRVLLAVGAALLTIIVGISRIYLGVHYPSDVLGAMLAGSFWLALLIWLFQWYMERRYAKARAK